MLKFHVTETALGHVGLVVSEAGLRFTTLPRPTRDHALREVMEMGAFDPASEAELGDLPDLVRELTRGDGRPASALARRVDWTGITPFRRAVLEQCMAIPAGQVITYGELAARAGRPGAARAAGRVMATNPIPLLIPCHRVVGSNGTLHGYGGGLDMKDRLLRAEGVALPR